MEQLELFTTLNNEFVYLDEFIYWHEWEQLKIDNEKKWGKI